MGAPELGSISTGIPIQGETAAPHSSDHLGLHDSKRESFVNSLARTGGARYKARFVAERWPSVVKNAMILLDEVQWGNLCTFVHSPVVTTFLRLYAEEFGQGPNMFPAVTGRARAEADREREDFPFGLGARLLVKVGGLRGFGVYRLFQWRATLEARSPQLEWVSNNQRWKVETDLKTTRWRASMLWKFPDMNSQAWHSEISYQVLLTCSRMPFSGHLCLGKGPTPFKRHKCASLARSLAAATQAPETQICSS